MVFNFRAALQKFKLYTIFVSSLHLLTRKLGRKQLKLVMVDLIGSLVGLYVLCDWWYQ